MTTDPRELCEALAELCALGVPVDLAALYRDEPRRAVTLPATPLETQTYWTIDRTVDRTGRTESAERPRPAALATSYAGGPMADHSGRRCSLPIP